MKFVNEKINDLYELFQHFTKNQWIYETQKIYEFDALMTPQERQDFFIDPKTFDWFQGANLYGYGIEKYMHKVDVVQPDGNQMMIIHKNQFRYFDDIKRAFSELEIIT